MKKIILLSVGFFILAALIYVSCRKELFVPVPDQAGTSEVSSSKLKDGSVCGAVIYQITKSNGDQIGKLIVSNDNTNIYLNFMKDVGNMGEIKIWLGTDLNNLPTADALNNANPIPGQFNFTDNANGVDSFCVTIPLAQIPSGVTSNGSIIYIVSKLAGGYVGAVHVDNGGTKWYYGVYTTCSPTPLPLPTVRLGTAFAKGNYVFTTDPKSNPDKLPTLGLTKNRWGWAINMTGTGSKTYNLFVGAGLNYTSKGIFVGSVTVTYNGSSIDVSYALSSGYAMEETHIYAGDLKPTTLAPGQYGNTFYFNPHYESTFETTIPVSDTNGDGILLIIHAIIYGPGVSEV